jgi:hypothetical protein
MMQAEDGSSDLDDDDFLGSLSPQDESTPLNISRGKSLLARPAEASPSDSPPSSAGSRKRKRPQDIQVPGSPTAQEMVEDTPTATPVARDRDQSLHMSEATPQPLQSPEIFSQTMAPPDSSPMGSSVAPQSPVHIAHNKSEINKPGDPTHLSTAALQSRLLPRRRQRQRRRHPTGEFDLPSESDEDMHDAASDGEDELNYLPTRRSRRGQSNKPKPLGNTQEKSKLNNQKQQKSKIKLAPVPRPSEPHLAVTYSRARHSGAVDKENELLLSSPSSSPLSSPPDSDASDSGEIQPARRYVSDELRAAAKKFAEVDKWQMEFEDVSASETQGSSAR